VDAEPALNPYHAWISGRLDSLGISAEEALAWTGLILVTALTRLWALGFPPLNVEEGRRALEAYSLLNDGRVTYESAPVLTNLTSLVFILFGDGDLQARLVPAVSGILLVLTPLLLRPIGGRWWSLLASLALAGSTTVLAASRTVSPAVPVLLCVALTAIGAWRFAERFDRRWLAVALVAVFAGIGMDTSFVIGLAGLFLAYAIAEGEIFGRVSWWPPVRDNVRWALVIAVGAAILLDTRFLTSPGGIQAGLFDPLSRWIGEVARGAGLTGPLLLGLLDGGILLLAVIGVAEYPRRPRVIRFLGTWLIVALTLTSLMRMPETRYLVLPVLPGALLAGFGLLRLTTWIAEAGSLRTTILGLVGLVPVVTAAFQVNAGLRANLTPWNASAIVLVAGLLLAGLVAFNLLRGMELGAAFATWLLVSLSIGGIAAAGRTLDAHGEGRGQLVEQTVMTRDMAFVREMALKWYRANPDGPLPVDPSLKPILAWELRDIPTVRYDGNAIAMDVPRLLADPPTQVGPDTVTIRQIVGYTADWPSLSLQPPRVWRWLANREPLVTLRPYAIVVVQPAGS
jgi:4-amino-4-deoxy-L-arabinose transferase-like glycosyltransferase